MDLSVEIAGPDGIFGSPRPLTRTVLVGRGADEVDIVIADPAISRRHLQLDLDGDHLLVTDLDSTHGTRVGGVRITAPTRAPVGALIELGDSQIRIRPTAEPPPAPPPPPPAAPVRPGAPLAPPPPPAPPSGPVIGPPPGPSGVGPPPSPSAVDDAPTIDRPPSGRSSTDRVRADEADDRTGNETLVGVAALRPVTDGWSEVARDGITVRHMPGGPAETAAPAVLDTARRARRALAGLGSEPGARVVLNVVPPLRDPSSPDRLIETGALVDEATGEAWLVVTEGSPPEDPHRVLARLFGAALPSAARVAHLLDGYGLRLSGADEVDGAAVAELTGPVESAPDDIRGPLAASFVAYLIRREGEDTFRRLLASPPDRLDASWTELYGRSATAMEAAWREATARDGAGEDGGARQFLKLSWRYLRPYRARQIEVFGYLLLSLAFTSVYPFVTRRLFDSALPSGELSEVLSLLGVLGVAFAISLVAGLRENYQSSWISGSVVQDLRRDIFGRVQRLPDSWLSRHGQGDVLSRLVTDVAQVQAGLSTAISDGIFQMISLLVATAIMMTISPILGLLVLLGAPIVAVVYRKMADGARRRSLEVSEDHSAMISVAAENYHAIPVIKAFGLARREEGRFERASQRLFRSQQRLSLFGGLFGLSVNGIVTTIRLLAIGLGAWLIFEGRFTIGGLVAFLGIMGEVLSPITGLTTLGQSIQSSLGSLTRLDEIMSAPTEPERDDLPPLAPLQREIHIDTVSLSYTAERRALDGADLRIEAGSRVAFVGPSGAGKSTVLRVLLRLYDPDDGCVRFDGVDVSERSLASLRAQMGVVFQDSFLFDATVRENIALGSPDASEEAIRAAARMAEVDSFIDALPRGYDTLVGEGGGNLSGGQRQRVAIARALVGDPQILLLDEATSALDPHTERQIAQTLERASAGRTTIAVTHRLASITGYDRIVVVDEGRFVEVGTHDELLALGGVYARLFAQQTDSGAPAGAAEERVRPAEVAVPRGATILRATAIARSDDDDPPTGPPTPAAAPAPAPSSHLTLTPEQAP